MIIEKLKIGAHSKKIMYAVCADVTETGDKLHEICRFDSLEKATAILKYLRGDSITTASDWQTARDAIKSVDAPTD